MSEINRSRRNKNNITIANTNDNSEFGQEFFDGDWQNDKMHGFGVYNYANGDIYEGEWENNFHSSPLTRIKTTGGMN